MNNLFDLFKRHERAKLAIKMYKYQDIAPEMIIETAEEVFGIKEAKRILTISQYYL
uniref:Uncharacterized protein n=1 Tax=viral metagenome TaxID=1070528 RepID=A0A6H1ZHF6_9ZZZZ